MNFLEMIFFLVLQPIGILIKEHQLIVYSNRPDNIVQILAQENFKKINFYLFISL